RAIAEIIVSAGRKRFLDVDGRRGNPTSGMILRKPVLSLNGNIPEADPRTIETIAYGRVTERRKSADTQPIRHSVDQIRQRTEAVGVYRCGEISVSIVISVLDHIVEIRLDQHVTARQRPSRRRQQRTGPPGITELLSALRRRGRRRICG